MSSKYKKITDEEVLILYYKLNDEYGWSLFNIPMQLMKKELNTSLYQVRKAYKSLEKQGYMKKVDIPTLLDEYDNGLYCETITILKTKGFDITDEGIKKAKELIDE